MKKIEREGDLPHSAAALFNALSDFQRFPAVFPAIKSATVTGQGSDFADVEMAFNLSPQIASFLDRDSESVHITWSPDHKEMQIASASGALKKMEIHWAFNEASAAKTHVKFRMEYETGMNFAKSMVVDSFIKKGTKDVIQKLGEHTAKRQSGPG